MAHAAADSSFAVVRAPSPTPAQLAFTAVALVGGWLARRGPGRLGVAAAWSLALLLLEVAAARAGAPSDRLGLTVLDVGQGDSTLVDLPDRRLMLIDAGGSPSGLGIDPGERVVAPVLRSRRRSRVDVVVITHAHPDHFGGMGAALDGIEVGEVWASAASARRRGAGALARLLTDLQQRGARLREPAELCAAPRRFGAAVVEVLAPCGAADPLGAANDDSIVLRIRLGSRAVLLVGDAEEAAERALLGGSGSLVVDLLKVGHHGSRSSTSASFLRAVRPATAVISCGARNRFGHPHGSTLERLGRQGIAVFRTDRGGALSWSTDGARSSWSRPDGSTGSSPPP
ncbi:MAG: MBL fold metallo-hydrolase [Deltaproteobacteria bacterium]|nr:MBL fold metallo-hydrolase [Deltaproteobacteria bacterium]MBW2530918.1 MBL fold metallo-hydrolase [Deltaproteobacteria bacterium]